MRATIKPLIQKALFLLLISLAGASYAQIPQIERDALVALYNSTNGASWKDNTGWNGAVGTECDWLGVTCSSGVVTQLSLSFNSLTGTIPAELGNLSNLTYLNLQNNSLSGTIPAELGDLSNLALLVLLNNSLSGSIPSELGSLTSLTFLNLETNFLRGTIPSELGSLTSLTYLNLSYNSLSGAIPSELGNLTKLTDLTLKNNNFSRPKPAWLSSFSISDSAFDFDADKDGIDDGIDADPNSAAMIKEIIGPDYSLSVLGSGRVVNIVSKSLFNETSRSLHSSAEKEIPKILYSHFKDEFDFIMIAANNKGCCSDAPYAGRFSFARNDIKGLGKSIVDITASFGSNGKLQGVIHFPYRFGLTRVGLHEILHNWGNDLIETEVASHWGYSNVGGQIGGWQPNSLTELGDGTYQTRGPVYKYWSGNSNGGPYSNLELYIMGLIGADEVGHDIKIAQDFNWVDSPNGIFEASSITTKTMDKIIAENGPREPDHLTSQKSFRAVYVVVSEAPLTRHEWRETDKFIYDFQLQGDDGNENYNFWEATQGKATMAFDQLDKFLTSQTTASSLVNPPAVSITGGDRTVADSDKVAGESVSLTATAADSDGTITTTQWLVGGVEVAAGLSASVSLPNGSTVVTFKATDNDFESTTTTATITVEAPAYEPTEEWPSPYNGVTPDSSYGLEFNNVGVLNSSDATIYVCLRLFTDGLPSSLNGVSQFDMGLKVASLSEATVQITKYREFNTRGALNEKAQAPDCSGIFETTTGVYTDIIQTDSSVLETTWNLIDTTNLIFKLDSFKELTAN